MRLHFPERQRFHERPRSAQFRPRGLPRRHGPIVRLVHVRFPHAAAQVRGPPGCAMLFRSTLVEAHHQGPLPQRLTPVDPVDGQTIMLERVVEPLSAARAAGLDRREIDLRGVDVLVRRAVHIVNPTRMIVGIDLR